MTDLLTRLKTIAQYMNDSAEHTLRKFEANYAKDRAYAFKWADGAMAAAAEQKVARNVLAWASDKVPAMADDAARADAIVKEIRECVLRAARYPSRSTSSCTNDMEQYEGAAFAQILERVGGLS